MEISRERLRSSGKPRESQLHNTLDLPCQAPHRCVIRGADDVVQALQTAKDAGFTVLPIGAGSNVVLPPQLDALILQSGDARLEVLDEDQHSIQVRVGAGYDWHAWVTESLRRGWYGLENLALIPGCVGAAPVQNIGAYGRELCEVITAVHGVDLKTGASRSLATDDCGFGYRTSVFKESLRGQFFISAVDFRLSRVPDVEVTYPSLREMISQGRYPATPEGVFEAVVQIRSARLPDPISHPNVGSFFHNPVVPSQRAQDLRAAAPEIPMHSQQDGRWKLSAAWMIEACGLRGHRHARARVSDRHALVLENTGGADQADVLALAAEVRDAVGQTFSVELSVEPRILGPTGFEGALP